jgi:hypothetical protein
MTATAKQILDARANAIVESLRAATNPYTIKALYAQLDVVLAAMAL